MNADEPYILAPEELRRLATDIASRRSLRKAARVFRIAPGTLGRVLADQPVSRGTVALLREGQRRIQEAHADAQRIRGEEPAR